MNEEELDKIFMTLERYKNELALLHHTIEYKKLQLTPDQKLEKEDVITKRFTTEINSLILKARLETRLSERAWAYRNMRNNGTDPQWIELARIRYEKAKTELKALNTKIGDTT